MIIQCPKCLTKFKMDDSKVKDEGTKVRCAKCKEVFVVTKEETSPVPPPVLPEIPVEKGEFDFSFGPPPEEEKEETSFQTGGGFGEETAKEPPTDFSFGEMPEETTKGVEEKEAAPDFGGMSFGEVSFSGPEETGTEAAASPSAFEFKGEEAAFGNIEFKEEGPSFEAPHEEAFKAPAETVVLAPPVKTEEVSDKVLPKSGVAFQENLERGGFGENEFQDEFPVGSEKETKRSFLRTLSIFALICVVASVPLWYLWTNYKGAESGQINLAELNGYFTQNAEAGNIFVITGMAVNNTNKARSFFQVRGILFSKKGEKLIQKEVFCGNVFSSKELTTLPRAKIEVDLINKVGSKLSNINLAPGKSVPFTIIFFDLPQDTAEFSVEVVGSQIAS
ncbi:MAG: zinc-ribbon domain-containing protein [Deltaproteobacteria bacterium]|nr:zinc-ribbon domain-containing protein [Deltaproteobacteria bacterium]